MPIVELKASNEVIKNGGGVEAAASFCRGLHLPVIDGFGIPEPDDFEIRVTADNEINPTVISCDLTEGPNEYPGYGDRAALFPSSDQLDTVGNQIQTEVNQSPFNVEETRITVWPNTTFLLQEEDIVENPKEPEELEHLQELARQMITEAHIKLVISPEQNIGISTSKESEPQNAELLNQEATRISKMIVEVLGITPELMQTPIAEVALVADTPVSLEFDCKTRNENILPEELRRFVAEKALFDLQSHFKTGKDQAEVWIRQNQPEPHIYTSS